MIPYLNSLTLEDINNTITAINDALVSRSAEYSPAPQGRGPTVIWEQTVDQASLEIVKNDLTMKGLPFVQAHLEFYSGNANGNIYLYVNGDFRDANYHRTSLTTVHGAAAIADAVDTPLLVASNATDDVLCVDMFMTFREDKRELLVRGIISRESDETLSTFVWVYSPPVSVPFDDVYKLTFRTSNDTPSIMKNSRILMWRPV